MDVYVCGALRRNCLTEEYLPKEGGVYFEHNWGHVPYTHRKVVAYADSYFSFFARMTSVSPKVFSRACFDPEAGEVYIVNRAQEIIESPFSSSYHKEFSAFVMYAKPKLFDVEGKVLNTAFRLKFVADVMKELIEQRYSQNGSKVDALLLKDHIVMERAARLLLPVKSGHPLKSRKAFDKAYYG
jgi:hypothetical protein